MILFSNSSPRICLFKKVERAFIKAGWTVSVTSSLDSDFRVKFGNFIFLIKCIDKSYANYDSSSKIIAKIEGYTHQFRSKNRQLIIVFDRNFLGVDFGSLLDREIFALALDDIGLVVDLAKMSEEVPKNLDYRQQYLILHCVEYTRFLAHKYAELGNLSEAITWARMSVKCTTGYSNSYFYLFYLLRKAEDFEGAAEVGKTIVGYRADDPLILRAMSDLENKRGKYEQAEYWKNQLVQKETVAYSFNDIIAKQRCGNSKGMPKRKGLELYSAPVRKSGVFSFLIKILAQPRRDD